MSTTTGHTHRILIVDDNKAIHGDFRKVLGRDNSAEEFDIEEAEFFGDDTAFADRDNFDLDFALQGAEALEMVESALAEGRPYSMAFMDVRMPPGWDGIETTSRIWEVAPDLQIVICTAYSDYSWSQMIERLGRTDRFLILKKPFDSVEVIQCAHALARKSELIRESRLHAESLEERVRERTSELNTANRQLEREIVERKKARKRSASPSFPWTMPLTACSGSVRTQVSFTPIPPPAKPWATCPRKCARWLRSTSFPICVKKAGSASGTRSANMAAGCSNAASSPATAR